MSEIFKSARSSNGKYVARQVILGLAVAAAWPLYRILIAHQPVKYSYYYIVVAVLTVTFLRELFQTRVTLVEFNMDTQHIIFHSSHIFSRTKQKILLFKYAKLEVDRRVGWRKESLILYFLTDKVEVCKIDKIKDGFSDETLVNMRDLALKLSFPVKKY